MTQREKDYAGYLYGIKKAREIAYGCLINSQIWPRYEGEYLAERRRHFARAHEYLERARGMRQEAVR